MTHANNRRGAFVYNHYDYFIKCKFLQAEQSNIHIGALMRVTGVSQELGRRAVLQHVVFE